jgi:hypothetical protein
MKLFKPEDFMRVYSATSDELAYYVNSIMKTKLKDATVVFCDQDELHFSGVDEIGYTHKGYLVGVEEIKKECDHKRVVVDAKLNYERQCPITRMWRFDENELIYRCRDCGKLLKADWKVK